jgi:hypothetical protein
MSLNRARIPPSAAGIAHYDFAVYDIIFVCTIVCLWIFLFKVSKTEYRKHKFSHNRWSKDRRDGILEKKSACTYDVGAA